MLKDTRTIDELSGDHAALLAEYERMTKRMIRLENALEAIRDHDYLETDYADDEYALDRAYHELTMMAGAALVELSPEQIQRQRERVRDIVRRLKSEVDADELG
jgi:hypothetical protein